MSEKREIDPGEGYVLSTKFYPGIQFHTDDDWFGSACNSQEEMNHEMSQGCVYRISTSIKETFDQVKSLGTAYDGSPMDLDWFINSLSPLCRLDKNSSGIGNIVALQQFVINLIGKKKDQKI